MVAEGLEEEVKIIFENICNGNNFLLSGGAGSGKTYSLVSVINEIYSRIPSSKIACLTYTNSAVHEIESRVFNKNLSISTIHDFLWENISSFQTELKQTLLSGINDDSVNYKNISVELPYSNDFNDGIRYTENLRISNGEISHDEVIVLANQMFKKYSKLCDILNDKYDYILIDEYQDSFAEVIEILLDFLSRSRKKSIIGFFGDSMQSIYDEGIGDLDKYIENGKVIEIQKKQNRRNPQAVINISNIMRIDKLVQEPSNDKDAPNMSEGNVKQGSAKFLYGNDISFEDLKKKHYFANWDFKNSKETKETKELRLTHNLIASEAGFPNLMEIYDKDPIIKFKNDFLSYLKKEKVLIDETQTFDSLINSFDWRVSSRSPNTENRGKKYIDVFLNNDQNRNLYNIIKNESFDKVKKIYFDKDNLISDKKEIDEIKSTQSKRDKLIRHLHKIQELINLYTNNKYNEFIRKTTFNITSVSDKIYIKKIIDKIIEMKQSSIHEIICYAHDSGLCLRDDNIEEFIRKNNYLYERLSKIKYDEFINLYNYLEGYVPISTQHKIKGEEFENVLVVLNNGDWTKYNFEYLFNPANPKCNENVLRRTQKLFYVCCTRAKENLVVYCENPSLEMIATAKKWFGKDNCLEINSE